MKSILLVISLFLVTSVWAQTPYGLQERVPNTSFKLRSVGNKLADKQLINAFPSLKFEQSLLLTNAGDGSNRLFVVEKMGKIYVFENDPAVSGKKVFLDLTARMSGVGETGLLSLAFHPDYKNNGKFYTSYVDADFESVISEWQVSADPDVGDAASERILLHMTQPQRNHNAGHIAFGLDSYLYISFGDGFSQSGSDGTTNNGDPLANGQNRENWFSCILRIDVDKQDTGLEYAIPPDNPFVGNNQNWKEEIFAYGLRNPWRFSFDRATGTLWCGDVGHKTFDEIDIIESGKNYGWSIKEGPICYVDQDFVECDSSLWADLTDPVLPLKYKEESESVTGGYVYRGEVHQSLKGLYIFGDYNLRKVNAVEYKDGVATIIMTITCPQNITSFGEDEQGEVYVVGIGGSIYKFNDNSDVEEIIPEKLSESGLFSDIQNKVYSPGLIPYDVNSPLWSDGADKTRLLALPDTSRIEFSADGHWEFPEDAVIVKNFLLETEKGNPGSKKFIETRFLVKRHGDEQWDGYSYEWNEDQTDAFLLVDGKTKEITIQDTNAEGGQTIHNYYFPSRNDCASCHTPVAGYVLGPRTAQLNGNYNYGEVTDNQLRSLNHIGMFTENIGEDYSGFPKLVNPADDTKSLSERARSYLDANCAQCHQQGGTGRADFDLRAVKTFEETKLLETIAAFGDLGTPRGNIISPGYPENSVLYLRITRTDSLRMPRIATSVVDELGAQVIYDWINNMDPATSVHNIDGVPAIFELYNAYPNPFNPSTTISFSIPNVAGALNAPATLKVYDILGEEVAILVNDYLPAGNYRINFDAARLASGIYFYRLRSGNFSDTKKMILVK